MWLERDLLMKFFSVRNWDLFFLVAEVDQLLLPSGLKSFGDGRASKVELESPSVHRDVTLRILDKD